MADKIPGIYSITNKLTGKIYIGQSWAIIQRWAAHRCDAKKNNGQYLYNSMRKHGIENFKFEIIKIIDNDTKQAEMNFWESYFIKLHSSNDNRYGYNLTTGGANGTPNKEVREKISRARKGSRASDEARRNMSMAGKGRRFTEEHKRKILEARKGYRHSDETKKKLAMAHIGKPLSDETRKKMSMRRGKRIKNIDTGEIFRTMEDAAHRYGYVGVYGLAPCANGKRATAMGYHWEWAKEPVDG